MKVNPARIEAARLSANMSRGDLAYAVRQTSGGSIKATERSIRRWEKNEHSPSDGVVPAIAEATGKPIEFFYGSDAEAPDEPETDSEAALRHDFGLTRDECEMLGVLSAKVMRYRTVAPVDLALSPVRARTSPSLPSTHITRDQT